MTAPARYQPISQHAPAAASQATAVEQSRAVAEVQAQIVVAQNCPRDINRAKAEMQEVCSMLSMSEQAFYQVPNRGNGASVHLMRELARIWGNIEHGSRELRRDESASEILAYAWDYQTNSRSSRTYIVPHERMKGRMREKLENLGDITNNNNNVAARAVRECIANVLPKWFTEEAQNICKRTLEHGEGKPLDQRIAEMVKAFKGIGITEAQLEATLGKKRGQWDAGDVAQAGIAYTSVTRDGYDKGEMFPPAAGLKADQITSKEKGKPGRGGGDDQQQDTKPSSGVDNPSAAGDQAPADVQMAGRAQLAQLKQIRQAERHDDASWTDFVAASIGRKVGADKELTLDEAATIIDLFAQDAQ